MVNRYGLLEREGKRMFMYLPVFAVVLSNTLYHICAKFAPDEINPFAALSVTYIVGAFASIVMYGITQKNMNLLSEYRYLNWSCFVMGLSVVGLEAGFIYMYKVGWNIGTGQIFTSAILTGVLLVIGCVFFHEAVTAQKVIGILFCMVGLFLINK